jgi:hypothetical protein
MHRSLLDAKGLLVRNAENFRELAALPEYRRPYEHKIQPTQAPLPNFGAHRVPLQ